MTRILLISMLLFACTASVSQGQDERVTPSALETPEGALLREISLEEALELAREGNFGNRTAASRRAAARGARTQSLAAFLPQVTVTEQAMTTNNPANAFAFQLKQERADMSLFSPDVLNDPDRITNWATIFQVQQPLFNPGGIMQRRAASAAADASSFMLTRTRQTTERDVKEVYFGLVVARQRVAVLDSALASAEGNLALVSDFFNQGLAPRADVLEAEVRLLDLQTQRAEAVAAHVNAAHALRLQLGMTDDVLLVPTTPLTKAGINLVHVDLKAINSQRADMQALSRMALGAKHRLQAEKSGYLPVIHAMGAYELNDDEAFGTRGDNWMAGVTLSWNLFSGMQRAGAVQRARAEYSQAEIAVQERMLQNEVAVERALRELDVARERLERAERGVALAREMLRMRRDRYEQNLEKAQDVLAAEVELATQRLALLNALYSWNTTVQNIEWLTR